LVGVSNRAVIASGSALVAIGALMATLAGTIGSPSWQVVSHRPVFWVGIFLALLGAVMTVLGVLPSDDEIPTQHKTTLRDTVQKIDTSITGYARIDFGDAASGPERRKEAFEAHFRKSKPLLAALKRWDEVVHQLNMAEAQLLTHLHIRGGELEIQVPMYDENLIITDIHQTTIGRARRNELSQNVEFQWQGFGDALYPAPGYMTPWITIGRSDGETDEAWRSRATERRAPVDQLLQEAQTWTETLQIGPLWKEVRTLQAPTSIAVQPILTRETFRISRRCPFCKENSR
jgi:hypothetical protein